MQLLHLTTISFLQSLSKFFNFLSFYPLLLRPLPLLLPLKLSLLPQLLLTMVLINQVVRYQP